MVGQAGLGASEGLFGNGEGGVEPVQARGALVRADAGVQGLVNFREVEGGQALAEGLSEGWRGREVVFLARGVGYVLGQVPVTARKKLAGLGFWKGGSEGAEEGESHWLVVGAHVHVDEGETRIGVVLFWFEGEALDVAGYDVAFGNVEGRSDRFPDEDGGATDVW